MKIENKQEKLVRIAINIPESKRDMIQKVVAKSSYNNVSEFVRAGIDKELDIQMYKDSLDFVVKELSKLIDMKLDGFINSQRKLYANNVRISTVNTYAVGEMMKRILGDEFHNDFIGIVKSAREKANYFVSRKTEDISKEELADFYSIGNVYRKE